MADLMKLLNSIVFFTIAESFLFLSLKTSFAEADGPHHTAIRGPSVIMAGVPAIFTCSADCTPGCIFTWRVERHTVVSPAVIVTWSGHQELLKMDCTALHPVTMNSEEVTKIVKIQNPVQVKANTSSDPEGGQNFTLTCVGAGPSVTTAWFKDSDRVFADGRVNLGKDNATLTFSPLLHSDDGYYDCVVFNDTFAVTSRGYLLSLGIITVSILGPDIAEAGVEHIFTCQANCTMECSTSWWFSHGFPKGSISVLGTMIRWTPAGPGMQEFQCTAENSLAQRSVQASKKVTVPARPTTPGPPTTTHNGSVMDRPAVALMFMACLQLLFARSL